MEPSLVEEEEDEGCGEEEGEHVEQDEKKSHVTTFPNARPLIKYVIFAKKKYIY